MNKNLKILLAILIAIVYTSIQFVIIIGFLTYIIQEDFNILGVALFALGIYLTQWTIPILGYNLLQHNKNEKEK